MDEAAQPVPPTQPSTPGTPAPPPPSESRERRGILIVVVLACVALAGIVAWSIGNDDAIDELGRVEERFPTPTTAPPPTTAAPATTMAPTTVPTASALPTAPPVTEAVVPDPPTTPTVSTTTAPATTTTAPPVVMPPTSGPGTDPTEPTEPETPGIVTGLVPNLAAYPEYLATPEQAQAAIADLLASGRHDVATLGPAESICAAVRLTQPLAVDSRWERDGRRLTSSDLGRRDAGFGECLGNGGEPLEDGSYQYVAIDAKGNESAAGGIVVGAARVEQRFVNDTAEAVCAIRVAPSASRYFEVYVYDAAPIAPGGSTTIPVADVRQDAEAVACADDEVVARFSFDPDAAVAQPLAG